MFCWCTSCGRCRWTTLIARNEIREGGKTVAFPAVRRRRNDRVRACDDDIRNESERKETENKPHTGA